MIGPRPVKVIQIPEAKLRRCLKYELRAKLLAAIIATNP